MNDTPSLTRYGINKTGDANVLHVADRFRRVTSEPVVKETATAEFAKVVRGHDGQLYLTFSNNVDAEFFLEDLGINSRTTPLYNCGGYENAILINEARAKAITHSLF